ncbi:hypothetical protein H6P81_006981 [Aristolochia fimbriata]|uniref:Uncharacterized protein n=1 Tax=Aristolochia fimbriata TaxID=158543 RepID=A0AAV7F2A4_ARIFI|nr:hypothetical protein H6P81_006981 [Aristolochia fimbriata]
MIFLGSRSFSPARKKQERRPSMSCRNVQIKAYGSKEEDQGRPTAYFQLQTFENWERRPPPHSKSGRIMTTTVVESCNPISFYTYIDLLLKPQELQTWFDGFFFHSRLFAETRCQIRRGLTVFAPDMIREALSKRFTRLDFIIEAHEVIDMSNLFEEPGGGGGREGRVRGNGNGSSFGNNIIESSSLVIRLPSQTANFSSHGVFSYFSSKRDIKVPLKRDKGREGHMYGAPAKHAFW